MGTENFGETGLQFFAKNMNSNFSKVTLTRYSEMLRGMPRVLRDSFFKFAWDCTVRVIHVAGAASKSDEYAGEEEVVQASLYYLC